MNTLTIKLKQHTPIIHFQHEQCGATLRASEVKPQLDRFLLFKLGLEQGAKGSAEEIRQRGKEKAKANKWLVGKGEHPALNYKMRIVPNSEPTIETIAPRFPCFFANMGDETEQKQFSYVKDGLTMTLSFPMPKEEKNKPVPLDWFEWISRDNKIAEFFFRYNFGTRGSKGFGAFYLDDNDNLYVPSAEIYKKLRGYRFFVNSTDKQKLFSDIELFYKFMREGINYRHMNFYCKPLIWWYCKDALNGTWEKKAIKKNLLRLSLKENSDNDSVEYYDVRDLFGLSSSESWRSYHATISKQVADIERMASPIFFKPILESNRFIVYMNVNTDIKAVGLNKFMAARQIEISEKQGRIKLDIPQGFSMTKFLKYFFDGEYSFEDFVGDKNRGTKPYGILKRIFDTITEERAKI